MPPSGMYAIMAKNTMNHQDTKAPTEPIPKRLIH
jgi:hypothetical protein